MSLDLGYDTMLLGDGWKGNSCGSNVIEAKPNFCRTSLQISELPLPSIVACQIPCYIIPKNGGDGSR